jgi:glycerol-3-phosphate O-acyltransferase
VLEYLEELKTTQRYELYRALEYPLYPIRRKIERIVENEAVAVKTVKAGRVVYVSNHRSHTDYLVELLVLDDLKFKPPIIAAGVNLFGGPLGLIHKHVTGALPIRRNAGSGVLITLRPTSASCCTSTTCSSIPRAGACSGEMKPMKAGLLNACLDSR